METNEKTIDNPYGFIYITTNMVNGMKYLGQKGFDRGGNWRTYLGSGKIFKKALEKFEGMQRRLTLRGTLNGVKIYDDYAHHPIEIKATLNALKSSVKGKIIAVFQPHRYSRFSDLWDDFLTCFEDADEVLVMDVYAAGETLISGVTAPAFVQALELKDKRSSYLVSVEGLKEKDSSLTKADTVVCLGAGSISAEITQLLKKEKGLKK